MNDVTGTMSDVHPLQAIISMIAEQQAEQAGIEHPESGSGSPEFSPDTRKLALYDTEYGKSLGERGRDHNSHSGDGYNNEVMSPDSRQNIHAYHEQLAASAGSERPPSQPTATQNPPSQQQDIVLPPLVGDAVVPATAGLSFRSSEAAKDPNDEFVEFRCNWKEKGLFGDTKAFGLVIRYSSSQKTMVRFDDVDAKWEFSQLEGPYGALSRYDMFVGAKVKIFGRPLTICSCNATVCHAIEVEGQRLNKKQQWLQSKIESVGMQPCVRRTADAGGTVIRNISRSSKSYGSANLRKISIANMKLREQMISLGLQQVLVEYEEREAAAAGKRYRTGGNFESRLLYDER